MSDTSNCTICVIHPNKDVYSETFIQVHIDHLPTQVKVLYGGSFPQGIHRPYSLRRYHNEMDIYKDALQTKGIWELVRTIEIGLQKSPAESRGALRAAGRQHYSAYAYNWSKKLLAQGHVLSVVHHALWGFRLHPSPLNFLRLMKWTFLSTVQALRPKGVG